ncbi:MAG: leucine-rich repeat protein [Clostridia bacterium]|nr:leucine-rich repeat protein [Clostridia bacterium]
MEDYLIKDDFLIEDEYLRRCFLNSDIITIPINCTKIKNDAFIYAKDTKKIILHKNVEVIEQFAFSGCFSLEEIVVDFQNLNFKSINGNLFSKDGTKLIKYCTGKPQTHFDIPLDVEVLGENAFSSLKNLKSITVPDGIKTVPTFCFSHCKNLEKIILPNSITRIEFSAFNMCTNLKEITFPLNLEFIGEKSFLACFGLKKIILPPVLKHIDYSAFFGCISLEEVFIPKSVLTIKNRAFSSRKNLKIYCEISQCPNTFEDGWCLGSRVFWNVKTK